MSSQSLIFRLSSNLARTRPSSFPTISSQNPLSVSSLLWRSSSSKTDPSAPATEGGKSTTDLSVSDRCAQRLLDLVGKEADKNKFLRLSVEGGGCSGFQYKFQIDDNLLPDDSKFMNVNYPTAPPVVVDPSSLEYLQGATVDFEQELIRSAFRVLSNPKAEHGCSCGASFTIKL